MQYKNSLQIGENSTFNLFCEKLDLKKNRLGVRL